MTYSVTDVSQTAIKDLISLLKISGVSGREEDAKAFIESEIYSIGNLQASIQSDSAHKKIGSGDSGNLIVKVPGTVRGPRRMLSAHLDTVPLCRGAVPVTKGDWIVPASKKTALGGDDRSGCAVLLAILKEIATNDYSHPPLTFLWTVQEEVGLKGARNVAISKLGGPTMCLNFDGTDANTIVTAATGDVQLEATIRGIASHAGVRPEGGVSAASIYALAHADLVENGWHGLVEKGSKTGSSNVGVIRGGDATNVVMEELYVRAEVRSHSPAFRKKIIKEWKSAIANAARKITNTDGQTGSVEWTEELKYESFKLKASEPVIRSTKSAIQAIGQDPVTRIGNGGLDANWLNALGIPTSTIGCGQHGIHTIDEKLHIPSFLDACRVGLAWISADPNNS